VGPEHSYLHETGRAEYLAITDSEAVAALQLLAETEGIIPALESSHAIAHTAGLARELGPGQIIVVNLSGRGDKDMPSVAEYLGVSL
jgi:tryptophan synthase beta chain